MYGFELSKLDKPGELKGIIDDYWRIFTKYNECHDSNNELRIVVENSIPIIWFGDLKAYQEKGKKWKIVTVGMNPSFGEFIENGQYVSRFFGTDGLIKIDKTEDLDTIIKSYNMYFQYNPYPGKFWHGFEKLLQRLPLSNGEKASYGDADHKPRNLYITRKYCKPQYTAVHIDYETALATDPTWSKLKKKKYNDEKKLIANPALFDRLLDYLDPNIVLFADPELKNIIKGRASREIDTAFLSTGKTPFERSSYIVDNRLYIYGQFVNFPFAMRDENKEKGTGKKPEQIEKDFMNKSFSYYINNYLGQSARKFC